VIRQRYGHLQPQRILDVGCGPGFSAFAYADVFPHAKVMGVDMGAPNVRFARRWNEQVRKVPNVEFFFANAESMPTIEDGTFDIINFAYVLHEMPPENAEKILRECFRILAPGGFINGLDVPYFEIKASRTMLTKELTFGFDWHDGSWNHQQGVEPYIGEYEFNTTLPSLMKKVGFSNVKQDMDDRFDSIFSAHKPITACPDPKPYINYSRSALLNKAWYEHGHYQTGIGGFFERDCTCTKLVYTQQQDAQLQVENNCNWKTPDGELRVNNATLKLRGPSDNGQYVEEFKFGPITNNVNYTIVLIQEDLLVEFDCSMANGSAQYCFHVMSTSHELTDDVLHQLQDMAASLHLNPSNAEWKTVLQKGCTAN